MTSQQPLRVEIIGGGLIGTSIGLKVAQIGGFARIKDADPGHERVANELLGPALLRPETNPDIVVIATPVSAIPVSVSAALLSNADATVIDTGSIKTKVILETSTLLQKSSSGALMARFVPSHPMAGREMSGPASARSDLFEGRAWAITPHKESVEAPLATAESFIQALGATVYRLEASEHDRQVAMTSHLPQVLSSALAGILHEPLDLAGQGLRDMTRLANSDPKMWQPILEGNRETLTLLLEEIIKSINALKVKSFDLQSVTSFMNQGALGAGRVPGKHGGISRNYGAITVVIPDKAGSLARLFNHCAEAQINIEDLRIEHSPGQLTGLISLYVRPDDLSTLNTYLSTQGWHVTITSNGA